MPHSIPVHPAGDAPPDDPYDAGYYDGLAQDDPPGGAPPAEDGQAPAAGVAAEERYLHGYWQGRHDREHHRLQLRGESHGYRYYLDGRPVHNGDQVEVQLEDGQWRQVRLEGLPAEILGHGLLPTLAGGYELVAPKALLRWPVAG
jgi:hypothetical protein